MKGELRAFVAVCSHKDRAMVPLRMKKGALVCIHHGATFDPCTGEVAQRRGNDVPTGLPPVELTVAEDGTVTLRARKRDRKLLPKKERKRMKKLAEGSLERPR